MSEQEFTYDEALGLLRANLALLEQVGAGYIPPAPTEQIRSPQDVGNFLGPALYGLEQEEFHVALLNTRNDVIGSVMVYRGTINSTHIRVCEVFREAVRRNAKAIILLHNHPSGSTMPSPEDVRATKALVAAGEILDIDVLDHLIAVKGVMVSLRQKGLMS